MALLYGLGAPDFTTIGLNPERLLPVEPMEFSIEGESEKKESKKFRDGKIVTAGSALASETYTMKIGIEAVNWLAMQFAFGELAGLTASVALPELKYASFNSSAEIVDSDLNSETLVWATVMTAGSWGKQGPLTRVAASATPTARQFKADITSNPKKLVGHSGLANAPVAYRIFKTHTNIESIGAEAVYTALSAFSFSGTGYLDEELVKIIIPRITRSNIPTLAISDVTKFELDFDMIVQGSFRTAFQVYNLTTAGVA